MHAGSVNHLNPVTDRMSAISMSKIPIHVDSQKKLFDLEKNNDNLSISSL